MRMIYKILQSFTIKTCIVCFFRQYLSNSLKTIEFIIFLATEECKCSCNDVILTAIIGVLGFIIILLIIYIVWLHKKGEFHYSIFVPTVWSENARESMYLNLNRPIHFVS